MIKIKRRHLPLQGKFVEGSQTVEGEDSLGPNKRCRKPPRAKELCTLVNHLATLATITKIDSDVMDTANVENHEVR
jgi:hypothetical protein